MEKYYLPYGKETLECSALKPLEPVFLESRLASYVPPLSEASLGDKEGQS